MGEPADALLGGRYRMGERIGAGGMAMVYAAEDTRLGRKVAVKRLHAEGPDDAARRFLREAKLGAALNHPNLVTVFDAFGDGQQLVIVMELIAGPDLGEAVRSGPLEQSTALRVLADVAAALDHIHAAGIIHRDVKPSNVLLAPDGSARLTDLGIARIVEDTQTTQPGIAVGSTPYMAPEQLSGEPVGRPADVYALALTAYESLSGEPVRTGMPAQIAYQATEAPPPDIRDVRPATSPAAAEVFKRALARRPQERPGSAGSFVRELGEALPRRTNAGRTLTPSVGAASDARPLSSPAPERMRRALPPPPKSPERQRLPRLVALGLVGLLLLAVAAVAIISLGGDDPANTSADTEPISTQPERDPQKGSGGAAGLGGANGVGEAGEEATEAAPGSPEAALQDFYELAAADDFDGAVAVASSNLESQLGGLSGIVATLDTLESIEFRTLEAISESDASAEVELVSVATHTDRTDECSGTATLVAEGDGWLVDQIMVDCVETG